MLTTLPMTSLHPSTIRIYNGFSLRLIVSKSMLTVPRLYPFVTRFRPPVFRLFTHFVSYLRSHLLLAKSLSSNPTIFTCRIKPNLDGCIVRPRAARANLNFFVNGIALPEFPQHTAAARVPDPDSICSQLHKKCFFARMTVMYGWKCISRGLES